MFVSAEDVWFAAQRECAEIPDYALNFFADVAMGAALDDVPVVKRAIVRKYVSERLEDGDAERWADAARAVALIERVSKSGGANRETWRTSQGVQTRTVRRDELGRFASRNLVDGDPLKSQGRAFLPGQPDERKAAAAALNAASGMESDERAGSPRLITPLRSASQNDLRARAQNYENGSNAGHQEGVAQAQHTAMYDHFASVASVYQIDKPKEFAVHVVVTKPDGSTEERVKNMRDFLRGSGDDMVSVGEVISAAWAEPDRTRKGGDKLKVSAQLYQSAATPGAGASLMSRGAKEFMGMESKERKRILANRGLSGDEDETRMSAFARKLSGLKDVLAGVPVLGTLAANAKGYDQLASDLGPSVRQTAYRLRGTQIPLERETAYQLEEAKAVLDNVPAAMQGAATISAENRGKGDSFAPGSTKLGRQKPALGSLSHHSSDRTKRMTSDQLRMSVTGDVATLSMIDALPGDDEVTLLQASGRNVPSRGVLLDRDGDPIAESVGMGEDHYLPFTAKMLSQAQGGQYVRTRATGGLTEEDITNLVYSGARRATVVSRSGVFTLELDPLMRGGRRYSDKTAAMIDRYSAMLKGLAGENTYLSRYDIPKSRQDQLRQEAREYAAGQPEAADAEQMEYQRLLGEERRNLRGQTVEPDDPEAVDRLIAQQVAEEMSASPNANPKVIEAEIRRTLEERKVRPLSLNAEGYGLALSALQQAFPQYVRSVSAESLPDFMASRRYGTTRYTQDPGERDSAPGRKDKGYVGRGDVTAGDTRRRRGTGAQESQEPAPEGEPPQPAQAAQAPERSAAQTSAPRPEKVASGSIADISATPLGKAMEKARGKSLKAAVKAINEYGGDIAENPALQTYTPDGIPTPMSKLPYTDMQDTSEKAAWIVSALTTNRADVVAGNMQLINADFRTAADMAELADAVETTVNTPDFRNSYEKKSQSKAALSHIMGVITDAVFLDAPFVVASGDEALLERRVPVVDVAATQIKNGNDLVRAVEKYKVKDEYQTLIDGSKQANALGDDVTLYGLSRAYKNNPEVLAAQAVIASKSREFVKDHPAGSYTDDVGAVAAKWVLDRSDDGGRDLDVEVNDELLDAISSMSYSDAMKTVQKYQRAWAFATAARKLQLAGDVDPKVLWLSPEPKVRIKKRDPLAAYEILTRISQLL